MTADDIRAAAAAGHEVASHTTTHARLDHLSAEEIGSEVADSRAILEEIVGAPVPGFAYPYGAFNEAAVSAVREAGYDYAAATDDHTRRDGFSIARIFVSDRDNPVRLEAKLVRHRVRGVTRAAEGSRGLVMRSVLAADRLRQRATGEFRERIPYAPERQDHEGSGASASS
jgi:peptidoglycan/xylan/chitin deacetylase (PgdA/CDA1 family)